MADRFDGRYRSVYNYGSTVFQPEIKKTEKEKRAAEQDYVAKARQRIEERAVQKKAERRVHSAARILFIGTVLVLAVVLASTYILGLSRQSSLKREITALEKQQETLRRENILLLNEHEKKIDYQAAYDYATTKLKMQVPEKRQIIYFSRSVKEYVVKSAEIPHE